MPRIKDWAPSITERAALVDVTPGDPVRLEIPHSAPTGYLTHGLFRYAGKLAPPLTAFLIENYTNVGDVILDPMCGGGTTAIEAITSGRRSINCDINPVSRLVTRGVTQSTSTGQIEDFAARVADGFAPTAPPEDLSAYFSDDAYGLIRWGLDRATHDAERVLMLSIARSASFANTKKINTVVDRSKQPKDPRGILVASARKFESGLQGLASTGPTAREVVEAPATATGLDDESVDFVLLHPPYLTNTAFSEMTELQLRLLGFDPKKLRSKELAYRGSYFHVPNGLRKYLVGWSKALEEAHRVLRPGGHLAAVNGDGRIEGVRIPVGAITEEFASDVGLKPRLRAVHILNNQTGMTLSRRMASHHVLVFEK